MCGRRSLVSFRPDAWPPPERDGLGRLVHSRRGLRPQEGWVMDERWRGSGVRDPISVRPNGLGVRRSGHVGLQRWWAVRRRFPASCPFASRWDRAAWCRAVTVGWGRVVPCRVATVGWTRPASCPFASRWDRAAWCRAVTVGWGRVVPCRVATVGWTRSASCPFASRWDRAAWCRAVTVGWGRVVPCWVVSSEQARSFFPCVPFTSGPLFSI